MTPSLNISVVIVSFNTCNLLRDCLKSIYENTSGVLFEVIVSDNGSVDGSVEMVKKEFPQVVLVENNANLGFGTANNRGLDVAKGEFVFYLNSDTLLLNNAIKMFYDYWKSHENETIGALGCNLVDADGVLTESYGKFPESKILLKKMMRHLLAFYVKCALKLFGRDISGIRPVPVYECHIGDVDYVVGADLFVKNSPYARFDENFFLYYEETDMQLRMKNDGLRRSLIEGPSVMHLVRGGKNKMDDVLRYGSFSIIQSEISKVRYTKKNLSAVIAFLLKLMISLHWLSPYVLKNTHKFYRKLWGV
ncbi:glycosyltransferase [uncultured Fibrobacter sp.]|uniref:glycosyltransferase n=1 Tax=uncultured Fibrobacter sp. TaxID=261512 RepID=UPI0025E6BE5E|nr:glycosyltransferase [uncultured Fibrobacter sp.]